jgi:hypothetical protein
VTFWLTRYIGSGLGTEADPFRPMGADELGDWSAIDLRPDSSVAAGFALLQGVGPLAAQTGRVSLGDDPDAVSPADEVGDRVAAGSHAGRQPAAADSAVPARRERPHRRTRWKPLQREGNRYRIWLGGLFDEFPAIAGGMTAISDNFNRADAGSLGANWTQISGTHSIVSNAAQTADSPPEHLVRHVTDLATSDHFAQADLNGTDGVSVHAVEVRVNVPGTDTAANQSCYMGRHNSTGTPQWEIFKRVAGAFTSIGSVSQSQSFPYTLKLSANGSTIAVFAGATGKLAVTDTAVTTGTRVGMRSNTGGAGVIHIWDNFLAADLRNALPFPPPRPRRVLMRSAR